MIFTQLEERGLDLEGLPGIMFRHSVVYVDQPSGSDDMELNFARQIVRFAGGQVPDDLDDLDITQIVVGQDPSRLKELRQIVSKLVYHRRIAEELRLLTLW